MKKREHQCETTPCVRAGGAAALLRPYDAWTAHHDNIMRRGGVLGFDDADAFRTEDSAFSHTRQSATHEMQIGALDSAGGQTHDGVEIRLDRRLLEVARTDVSNSMENDGFHGFSPGSSF